MRPASLVSTLLALVVLAGWLWFVMKIGISWKSSIAHERDRLAEAELVDGSVCSTLEGQRLAYEFVKCNDARVMKDNRDLIYMRAFEATLRTVAEQTVQIAGAVSLAAMVNVVVCMLATSGLVMLGNVLGNRVKSAELAYGEPHMYSLAAQARLESKDYFIAM